MKNSFKVICITCIGLFIMSGCTSPNPAMNEYRLAYHEAVTKAKETSCSKKTLKVEQAYSNKLFKSLKMYYGKGKYKQYAYAQSQWIESPNAYITQSITEYLRQMQLFASVQNASSKTKNDFRLEINIEDFMQYFDANEKNSYVNVVITCNIIDTASHKIVATKTFKSKLKAKSEDALGGVMALDSAFTKILKECGLWLKGLSYD